MNNNHRRGSIPWPLITSVRVVSELTWIRFIFIAHFRSTSSLMPPKVWFITGVSSGLGRALTEHVLKEGEIAVATLRNPQTLSDLSTKYPTSQLLVVKVDVTKPDDITSAFKKVQEEFGRLDVVVNNAGYGALAEIEGTPVDGVARGVFEVNFWGAANVSREAVRFFRDVNVPGVGGRLLQISSMAGVEAGPAIGYYSASSGFSESLRKELNPAWNIKINVIEPGGFQTRGTKPESLVTVPPHPAYDYPGSLTSMVRQYITTAVLPGDANKAVGRIYEIVTRDGDLPFRIQLGKDSIAAVKRKIDDLQADVVEVEKQGWSENLLLAN
ncbi:hypothetical protein JAAARDRAFT_62885 [Jaapia argillacea MUCL 33604]|uniref:NAD(P)-binding protein n=1 Tax=Jaapia argillacea MUCL 33604 TaxID=933084 RepID=A0A067PIL7_9AGAM|nr:hypothetical protein JAAARDRAFT_62885 [Jaapia argillacea MUCL 33604]